MMATWGPRIDSDGSGERPAWLRDNDQVYSPWTTGVGLAKNIHWDVIRDAGYGFMLLPDHPYYTVKAYNEKHGTSFYPWGGGDEAPTDWDGGAVLWLDGMISPPISPSSPSFIGWTKRVGFSTNSIGDHIIGYTRRSEPVATDVPEGYIAGPWITPTDERTPDFPVGSFYQMASTEGQVNPAVHVFKYRLGSYKCMYRQLYPVATTDDTVQIARMTEAEVIKRFRNVKPYAPTLTVMVLRHLGLIKPEPTEAERIAATTGLTVEQVQAVLDAR